MADDVRSGLAAARSASRARQRTTQRRARPLPQREGQPPAPVGAKAQKNLELLQMMESARERRANLPPLEPPKPKAPSLLQQAGGLISGIPQGVIGLAKEGVESVVGAPRLLIDLARQRVPEQVDAEGGWQQQFLGGTREYFPLLETVSRSGAETVNRATHPSEYLRASREGRLLPAIVEDIGNVALAGGVASRALGTTGAAASRSLGELPLGQARAAAGGARPLSVGAMAAEDLSVAPLLRHAGAPNPAQVARVVPFPETATVALRGRGLAGVAERAGAPRLAAGLERAGNVTRSATRLGERAANAPAAPYALAARGIGRGVEAAVGRRPGALLRAGVERAGARGGTLFPYTEEGRRFNEVKSNIERSQVDAQRFAIVPAKIAEDAGLAPHEARAALLSVDKAVQPVVAMVRRYGDQVGDEAIDEIIRRTYERQGPGGTTLESGMRPTPDDVRAVIAYEDRALPEQTMAGMDAVAAAQQRISEQSADVLMGEGKLNPEQVEAPEMLTLERGDETVTVPKPREFVQRREERLLERGRDRTQRKWERGAAPAARLTRIADATEAVNAELPAPPRADLAFDEGARAGRAAKGESLARRAHAAAQVELRRALDTYVRMAEGAAPEMVQRAAAEVDRLTERAVQLEAMVSGAERRLDAASALSRVSGEVEEGAPAQPRPPVDITKAEGMSQVKARAREIADVEAGNALEEIDRITGNTRPWLPEGDPNVKGQVRGQYDFWIKFDPELRRMLTRENWFVGRRRSASAGRTGLGSDPENFAMTVSGAVGRELTVDEAMRVYLDAVRRYREAKGARSPEVIAAVAEDLRLSPEAVQRALQPKARVGEYQGVVLDQAEKALDDMRADYLDLPGDERRLFDSTLDQMLADPDVTPGDLGELLDAFLPASGIADPDGPLAALGEMVDLADVAQFVRTGEQPATMRAVGVRRGPAQQRQIGRMEGNVAGARARLGDTYGEQRRARRLLGAAERQAERGVDRAGAAVERAGAIEEGAGARVELAGAEAAETAALRPSQHGPWRRYPGHTREGDVTAPPSAGERAMIEQGATRARADAAQARQARLRRSLDRANKRIADVPTELSRRFQERLATDINQPTVVRVRNVVRKGGERLGDVLDDKRTGPYLTGVLRRVAEKYHVYDDVLYQLTAARAKGRTAITPADRAALLLDTIEQGRQLPVGAVDRQALADSVASDQLLDDIAEAVSSDRAAGLQANTPYRVLDLVEGSPWAPRMPDDLRSQVRKIAENYEKQRARHLRTVFDADAEAAPARFRTVMQTGRRQVRALLELAEEKNRADAGSGDIYIEMAEATATTLNELVDQGIDPVHLIGGDDVDAPSSVTGGRGGSLAQRSLRATHVRRTGLRPLDPDAVARVGADQMAKMIHDRSSTYVVEQFGQRADEVPAIAEAMRQWEAENAEPIPPKELAKAAKEAGWVPAEGSAVDPQTVLVSEAIKRQLATSRLDQSKAWQLLRTGNRKWKSWVLPLSPKWFTGNVIGNVIQATVHAGVNPVTLARRMREISRMEGGLDALWDKGGLPQWAPAELASHGLSYNEWKIMYQQAGVEARTPVGKTIAKSYRLNEFVDNLTRSAVFLEKLRQGVPSEAAMDVALKSMGDFTRMSSFERNVVREILPFYAWMRHQTMATLRLPIHSPARAAWLLHLADLYTDDDMRASLLEFIGSSIPLGGDRFIDAGSVSPFATLPEVPFAPTAIGRSVSPLLKVPLAIGTGIDLNRAGQQVTRPASTMGRGAYGEEEATPPLYRLLADPVHGLGEIGYIASRQAPSPIRSLTDLALGPNARYGTGYEVTSRGRPLPDERRAPLTTILRGLSLPAPRTIDLEEMERRAKEQERRQRG